MKEKKEVTFSKVYSSLANIHRAFMQPKRTKDGKTLRKQYWLKAWGEVKRLSPSELQELTKALQVTQKTLSKLKTRIEELRQKKISRLRLESLNQWEEEEFLDSAAVLPVFKPKERKFKGKHWVVTIPIERPKTVTETCQAIWTVITNRAINMVDGGKDNVRPNPKRDLLIERHRLSVLPKLLDDKIITDPHSNKPIMNIYQINKDVKELMLWLLADYAKREKKFRKLFIKFLRKEIIKKAHLFEWAEKFKSQSYQILDEILRL